MKVRVQKPDGDGSFVDNTSENLKVGDVVLIKEGETFPADLAVLATSSRGDCFIKTSCLDGEKNLKKRFQKKDFEIHVSNDDLKSATKLCHDLRGKLVCGEPDKSLHKLDGSI